MKNILCIMIALFITSCASMSPVGSWDYKISGTPQGDYSGIMTVKRKEKKTLEAVMESAAGKLSFTKFTYNHKAKKSSGDFTYQGMSVAFDATLSAKEMNGTISVQGMDFPFKAVRQK